MHARTHIVFYDGTSFWRLLVTPGRKVTGCIATYKYPDEVTHTMTCIKAIQGTEGSINNALAISQLYLV